MLKVFVGLLVAGYPFVVYFAADAVPPRYLALLLATVFALRWMQQGREHGGVALLVPACLVFLLAVAVTNEADLLLAYPVVVSAAFLLIFSYSLRHPPSIAEKFARLREPDLPPRGVRYTRAVTHVWCLFFALNGLVALATVLQGDRWLWSLYNGFISYVLMGILMGVEWLVRRKVRASF